MSGSGIGSFKFQIGDLKLRSKMANKPGGKRKGEQGKYVPQ
jgi:hypothetical protein